MSHRKLSRKPRKAAAELPMNPEFLVGRLTPEELESAKSGGGDPGDKSAALLTEMLKASEKVGWSRERANQAATDDDRKHYAARAVSAMATREGIAIPYAQQIRRTQAAKSGQTGGRTNVETRTRKPRSPTRYLNDVGEAVLRKHGVNLDERKFKKRLRDALGELQASYDRGEQRRWPWLTQDGVSRPCPEQTLTDYARKRLKSR